LGEGFTDGPQGKAEGKSEGKLGMEGGGMGKVSGGGLLEGGSISGSVRLGISEGINSRGKGGRDRVIKVIKKNRKKMIPCKGGIIPPSAVHADGLKQQNRKKRGSEKKDGVVER